MKIVEILFIQQLKKIKLDKFTEMLDQNISFIEFFNDKMPNSSEVYKGLKFFGVNEKDITFGYILRLIEKGNPEAYQLLITHQNGQSWLEKTIFDLKKFYKK